ncbi:hypothetical protein CTAYLR_000138 [Chrysophaeum taylorii]|uniref:Uncharacterized protein n=1 Tax=Chrysophaeum taylorii TaxID=2483200 RepID=A0AAD7XQS6_9STRA|nr:hypothetical protein CTAYLR_000138 [Chrysophaeum taylorii]
MMVDDETTNGVPDVCMEHVWCPFNPDNRVTNDNFVCHVFGNIGYKYFDRRRNVFMGVAMWSTLVAIFVTSYGALSLSTNPKILRVSYWALITSRNDTHTVTFYLGLRAMLVVDDDKNGAATTHRLGTTSYGFGGNQRKVGYDDGDLDVFGRCKDAATANQAGALLSCATLGFAFAGTRNRVRVASDANVQKALGLIMDTWGVISLTFTLWHFRQACFANLPTSKKNGLDLDSVWGPAWVCYLFCAMTGIIRAGVHWITPVPGNGAGACTFSLPDAIVDYLDFDGDGQLTWKDQRIAFQRLTATVRRQKQTHHTTRRRRRPFFSSSSSSFGAAFFFFRRSPVHPEKEEEEEEEEETGPPPLNPPPVVHIASIPSFMLVPPNNNNNNNNIAPARRNASAEAAAAAAAVPGPSRLVSRGDEDDDVLSSQPQPASPAK